MSAVARGTVLRLCRRADPAELRGIRRNVAAWAECHALPEHVLIDLQLAVGEAVANAVEHAYRDTEPGTVGVDAEVRRVPGRDPVVAVRVTDHGRWRPVPLVNGYRGRGLAMIERLARRVVVSGSRLGTEICFEIPVRSC